MRPAVLQDVAQLAAIKSSYIRSLYRGFLPEDYLREASAEFYLPEVSWLMKDQRSRVDVLEDDGHMIGFIVYGADPSDPGYGLIREQAIEPIYGRREKDQLARHAISSLEAMGYPAIHLWVLRDNFRARFLIESIGFRADGMVRVEARDHLELHISRYVYRMPVSGSGLRQEAGRVF